MPSCASASAAAPPRRTGDRRRGRLRLVEQRELAPAQRTVQPAVGEARAVLRHLAIEEHCASAPELLGAIHRAVGLAHELFDPPVVGEQRDADARAHVVVTPAEIHRQRERLDDALGEGA